MESKPAGFSLIGVAMALVFAFAIYGGPGVVAAKSLPSDNLVFVGDNSGRGNAEDKDEVEDIDEDEMMMLLMGVPAAQVTLVGDEEEKEFEEEFEFEDFDDFDKLIFAGAEFGVRAQFFNPFLRAPFFFEREEFEEPFFEDDEFFPFFFG